MVGILSFYVPTLQGTDVVKSMQKISVIAINNVIMRQSKGSYAFFRDYSLDLCRQKAVSKLQVGFDCQPDIHLWRAYLVENVILEAPSNYGLQSVHKNGSVDVMDRLIVLQVILLNFLLVHNTAFINSSCLHSPFVCCPLIV